MPWDFWVVFAILAIVLPWRGHERMRALLALPEVARRDRMKLYVVTILFQWALASVVGWRALARGLRWTDLGVAWPSSPSLLAATLGGAILIAVGHWANV